MALTRAQIRILRVALTGRVLTSGNDWEAGRALVPIDALPFKGAAARRVITTLQKRGLLDKEGGITPAGRGALLRSPEASSEVI